MLTILAILLLIGFGWLIWKAPPLIRIPAAIILVVGVAFAANDLATKRERSRLHNTYFRGLSMAFWELEHLSKTNDIEELTAKLTVLNRDFPNTTRDERDFNALMEKMLNPSRTWRNN